jgi:class 3 adenylate cyclase
MPFRRSIFVSASEGRLQSLIDQRLAPGADKEMVDRRIWDLFGEEWCVMATDLVGFSRGVAKFGIVHFLQTIYEAERLLVPVVENHDGIILKMVGDSFLVIFRNVQKAIRASIEMQRTLRTYNENKDEVEHVLLGVGLAHGRVLRIGDSDVFGAEVNAAYILGEETSVAYEILVTKAVREAARGIDGIAFEEMSEELPAGEKGYRLRY